MLICFFWVVPSYGASIDCGVGSTLLISSIKATSFQIDGVMHPISRGDYYQLNCSGVHDLLVDVDTNYSLLEQSQSAFAEQFLLGLSGLCAGFIFSFVLAHNTG